MFEYHGQTLLLPSNSLQDNYLKKCWISSLDYLGPDHTCVFKSLHFHFEEIEAKCFHPH